MKKMVIFVGILLMAGVAFADDVIPLNYQFPVSGTPVDNTFTATLDNTAKSIQTLAEAAGITWMQNGRPPQGALISVETYAARVGATGVTAGSVGHVLAVGSSWHITGAGFINALKLTSAAAGSYPVVQITLER